MKFLKNRHANLPGPGSYTPRDIFSKSGQYFISKYSSSGARTFVRSNRDTFQLPNASNQTPGPGSYLQPSDFGVYESKKINKKRSR